MNRYLSYCVAAVIILGMGLFHGLCVFAADKNVNLISRNIQYSFTVQNTTNHLLSKTEFWTYAPIQSNSIQNRVALESSLPYQLISDKQGNQIIHINLNNVAPYASSSITIKAKFTMQKKPKLAQVKNLKPYLSPEKYIESDNPEIKKLAQTLKEKTVKATAGKTFNWVYANIKYDGYSSYDRGALYALREKKGDCSEFTYLFVALCRANGIPARAIGGYICPESAILSPEKYHNWAEIYIDDSWQIADPQNNLFLKEQADYIAMRIIGEDKNSPMNNYHRFRFEGEGLKVKMN
jgi:transglutaminase-like putative cysteine protease